MYKAIRYGCLGPVGIFCMMQQAQASAGDSLEVGQSGGRFQKEGTWIPMADLCWWRQKPAQYSKAMILQLKRPTFQNTWHLSRRKQEVIPGSEALEEKLHYIRCTLYLFDREPWQQRDETKGSLKIQNRLGTKVNQRFHRQKILKEKFDLYVSICEINQHSLKLSVPMLKAGKP